MFKKAERSQTKLRLALTGPAGSGKTLSSLKIARGLVGPEGKIALIDSENGSASYYANEYSFDTLQLTPPYLISKYVEAIKAASSAAYDCIIVDSISHAWAGEGGILQRKEQLDQRPRSNSFTNWGKMTPEQNALVNTILHGTTNIICTMRSKTEYALRQNDKGKAIPHKIGLAPIQRDGFEYEFDIVLDIDQESHLARPSKDRTGLFHDEFIISEAHGKQINEWQLSGKPLEREIPKTANPSIPAPDADKSYYQNYPMCSCGNKMIVDKYDDTKYYCLACKKKISRSDAHKPQQSSLLNKDEYMDDMGEIIH